MRQQEDRSYGSSETIDPTTPLDVQPHRTPYGPFRVVISKEKGISSGSQRPLSDLLYLLAILCQKALSPFGAYPKSHIKWEYDDTEL